MDKFTYIMNLKAMGIVACERIFHPFGLKSSLSKFEVHFYSLFNKEEVCGLEMVNNIPTFDG